MKALPDKVIVYDNNCPMCSLYTGAFVKWGILERQNRISFADLEAATIPCDLDLNRARHEIPLLDLQGGKTIYGLDALLYVLGNKIPLIKRVFQIKPIHAFCILLYEIVSYNRRIIVPANIASGKKDFGPDASTRHRLFFVGISCLLSCLLTYIFGNSFNQHLHIPKEGLQIVCIAIVGWCMQILAGLACIRNKKLDYIGHLAVTILIGALILLPAIMADAFTDYQYAGIPIAGAVLSAKIMLWQHFIRIRHLQLDQNLTVGWFLILLAIGLSWMF